MANTDSIVVRRACKDDITALEAFYRRDFPDRPRLSDMALWRWEFTENPQVSDNLPFFVIESGGNIHGTIGYVPLRLRVGERTISSGHPVNYFVGPQYIGLPALQLFRAMQNDCPIERSRCKDVCL